VRNLAVQLTSNILTLAFACVQLTTHTSESENSRAQKSYDLLVLVLVLVDVGHKSRSFIVPHSSTCHNDS